ncbi:MAG: hypothetical protein ACQJCO_02485 [cyanobacterium endosymbiont of Rhopalodia sterrenbergii]
MSELKNKPHNILNIQVYATFDDNEAFAGITYHVNEVIAIYPITLPYIEKNGQMLRLLKLN